jgi:hypothetical protein
MTDQKIPTDGFEYPMTVHQQLVRLNRIATVLWQHRPLLELGPDRRGRVAVEVTPDMRTQITLQVHSPAELDDATAVADALKLEPARRTRVARSVQHYWLGDLGGFRTELVWIEHDHSRDTQGRPPLPVGVGVGATVADRAHAAEQVQVGVRLALGDIPAVEPRFAPRPAEADMPPAPVADAAVAELLHSQVPYGQLTPTEHHMDESRCTR